MWSNSAVFWCVQDADVLYRKHQNASAQLELKYNETRLARERAAELKERASDMYTSTKTKVDRLTGRCFTQPRLASFSISQHTEVAQSSPESAIILFEAAVSEF